MYPHLSVERHLLRKLYEYRLVIDICLASRRRSRAAACCCKVCWTNVIADASYCLSARSTTAQLTVLWLFAYEVYTTDTERLVRGTFYTKVLLAAVRTRYVLCWMVDGNGRFHNAPLGSTIALTASSFIPVRLQPPRACAEPPAGVTPPRRSPPCTFVL